MRTTRLRLKHAAGWFAAGRETTQALALLSDAAFKGFVWLCLNADRSRGALRAESKDIARALGKSETETTAIVAELVRKGVCRHAETGLLEITDSFWPYERAPRCGEDSASVYLAAVNQLLRSRACVRCAFAAADQNLALELYDAGVPLEQVERAIHLGCLRKYAALLNHPGGAPITSLRYFAETLAEVEGLQASEEYWRYVAAKMVKLEQQWRQPRLPAPSELAAARETK